MGYILSNLLHIRRFVYFENQNVESRQCGNSPTTARASVIVYNSSAGLVTNRAVINSILTNSGIPNYRSVPSQERLGGVGKG